MSEQLYSITPKLILTIDARRKISQNQLSDILAHGEFVSVITYDLENDATFLQRNAEAIIETVQSQDVAFLVANDSRIAGRIHADGIHIEGKIDELQVMLERHKDSMIVGFGNLRDKHSAMIGGECEPDYLMFGKLGADKKPEPHPRNLALSTWWAEVMEIPAIIQAGSDLLTFHDVLATKAEFIAVEEVLFNSPTPVATLERIAHLIVENNDCQTEPAQ